MEYKEVGKLIDQKSVSHGAYRLQLNLHEIRGYEPERQLFVWCQTDKSRSLQIIHSLGGSQEKASIMGKGWNLLGVYSTNSVDLRSEQASSMFRVVNESVAFWGGSNVTIKFDACLSTRHVHPDVLFYDLVKKGDVSIPLFSPEARPFFREFYLSSNGGCFEVDSSYVRLPNSRFQLCTTNGGQSWVVSQSDSSGSK